MNTRPLLLGYLTKQVGSKNNNFQYDHTLSLSVVEIMGKITPAIDLDIPSLSMETFTKAQGEGSDDDFKYCISTETRIAQEDSDCCIDLMLATKTLSNVESDD